MIPIQPPPPPEKTGNAQVDAYLTRIYKWAYLLWFYMSGEGRGDAAIIDSSTGGAGSSALAALRIPGLDGEDGEDGQMGLPGQQGAQGVTGQSIPGLDGQDGEDGFVFQQRTYGATFGPAAVASITVVDGVVTAIS
ncbi:MAG: hypothetical protein Q8R92_13695 [Deltaproteobacteria bacterium]|nr:hypothetical protein [Deltaproteobacteria bacterium]